MPRLQLLTVLLAGPLWAQEALTLKDAVRQALQSHPAQQAAQQALNAAASRVEQAKSGYLPRVAFSEFYQTSNQPVFAFASLLNQRRFTADNFALDALNHPGFFNNFQSQFSAEQTLWDFGATRTGVKQAELGRQLSAEQQRFEAQQRIAAVARSYHAVTLAREAQKISRQAIEAADADLARAQALVASGMGTDADVLSLRVHQAAMREQEIRRKSDAEIAQAALNEAMGAPLETARTLTTPLSSTAVAEAAAAPRPELKQAQLARALAGIQQTGARKAYLPQIVARTMLETDRGRPFTQGSANWFAAVGLRWNLYDPAVRPRVAESGFAIAAAQAREKEVAQKVSLEVLQARAHASSAAERFTVAEVSVAQSEESLRILRNRYEAGLARVDEVLRGETALLETQLRRLGALFDQRMAAVEVDLATGVLQEDSHVLD